MRSLLRRLRARIRYRHHARDLARELEVHRALAEDALARGGLSAPDARWRAARLLGNATLAREEARAVWVARWIDNLRQDVRYTMRTLRRDWGFALAAIGTLTLGLGVLLGIGAVVNGTLLKPWPVRNAHEVFGVTAVSTNPSEPRSGPIVPYAAWQAVAPVLTTADLAVRADRWAELRQTATSRSSNASISLISPRFLETVGIRLARGTFDAAAANPPLVITHALWQSRFGGDPNAIGSTVLINNRPVVIGGVLESRFRGFPPLILDGMMPLNPVTAGWLAQNERDGLHRLQDPGACCFWMTGRRAPNVSRQAVTDELSARVNEFLTAQGQRELVIRTWGTRMVERPDGLKRDLPAVLMLMLAGGAFVAVLACANLGNLQLARVFRRERELAVRVSLGASRARVLRQLATESAVLTATGTAGGLWVAWVLPPIVMRAITGTSAFDYAPDVRLSAAAVGISVVAMCLTGLGPALIVTRGIGRRVAAHRAAAVRLRGGLLAAQVALGIGLMAGAALLARGTYNAAIGHDAGFAFRDVVAYRFAVSRDSEAARTRRASLQAALEADPSLPLADNTPWQASQPFLRVPLPGAGAFHQAQHLRLNHAAIALLELPLLAGRWPAEPSSLGEAAVSRSFARAVWGTDDVIGRTFDGEDPFLGTSTFRVVGVTADMRIRDEAPWSAVVLARRGDYLPIVLGPATLDGRLRALAASYDPTVRVLASPLIRGLQEQLTASLVGAAVAGSLAAVALMLAGFGVFGVFSYTVEQRRREIGIRLALGAGRRHVTTAIADALRWPLACGAGLGLVLAVVAGFALRRFLFGVSMFDPIAYLGLVTIVGGAAAVAAWWPLRRAMRVDPAVTLRAD